MTSEAYALQTSQEIGRAPTPPAIASIMFRIWEKFLRFDPADPMWPNRDRFVLAANARRSFHRMIQRAGIRPVNADYAHLGELALSGSSSRTFTNREAIEISVRMAIASRWLGQRFNRPGFGLFDHQVVALAGDDMVAPDPADQLAIKRSVTLAGALRLSHLTWICICERNDLKERTIHFHAEGWNVVRADLEKLPVALRVSRSWSARPTLILLSGDPPVREFSAADLRQRGRDLHTEWMEKVDSYGAHHPELAEELAATADKLPNHLSDDLALRCFSPF